MNFNIIKEDILNFNHKVMICVIQIVLLKQVFIQILKLYYVIKIIIHLLYKENV